MTQHAKSNFSGSSEGPDNETQISFPVLPAAESSLRFALFREWLQWCDESHYCSQHNNETMKPLPTRLIDVGEPDDSCYNPDVLKLVRGQQIGVGKYIALSPLLGHTHR